MNKYENFQKIFSNFLIDFKQKCFCWFLKMLVDSFYFIHSSSHQLLFLNSLYWLLLVVMGFPQDFWMFAISYLPYFILFLDSGCWFCVKKRTFEPFFGLFGCCIINILPFGFGIWTFYSIGCLSTSIFKWMCLLNIEFKMYMDFLFLLRKYMNHINSTINIIFFPNQIDFWSKLQIIFLLA